jgi:predicted DNA-binding protein
MTKDKIVHTRMSDELYNMLQFKAEAAGVSPAEFVRQAINNTEVKYDDSRDIGQLIGALNKIGNNLNQIAHRLNKANKEGALSDIDFDIMKDELFIIRQALRELIQC